MYSRSWSVSIAGILDASILGALGAGLLPEFATPYLGLLPLALGLRAAWSAVREHRRRNGMDDPGLGEKPAERKPPTAGPGVFSVARVTLANGGDNIGAYGPVFAATGTPALVVYVLVFLILIGVRCAVGYCFARRPLIAKALSRCGHVLLPIVLIAIGLIILVEGHAFGL